MTPCGTLLHRTELVIQDSRFEQLAGEVALWGAQAQALAPAPSPALAQAQARGPLLDASHWRAHKKTRCRKSFSLSELTLITNWVEYRNQLVDECLVPCTRCVNSGTFDLIHVACVSYLLRRC